MVAEKAGELVGFAQWGEAGGLVERPEDGIIKHLYLNPESPEAGAIQAHRRGDPDVAFLQWIGVKPEYRSQGLGAELLNASRPAVPRGLSQVAHGHGREQPRARRFYERMGFACLGKTHSFVQALNEKEN